MSLDLGIDAINELVGAHRDRRAHIERSARSSEAASAES